jgi:hypothetical protein
MDDFNKVEWKVNVKGLFEEILINHEVWIVQRPLEILHSKLLKIASIANEQQNEEIMKLCCELALYEECDPYSSNFDKCKSDQLIKEKTKTNFKSQCDELQ